MGGHVVARRAAMAPAHPETCQRPRLSLPAVAVITRTKDRAVLLHRAMESVLSQTEADWIHVVVNDGGEAAPVDRLAAAFADRYAGRLHVIHNPRSLGMEAASNVGLRASDSRYVVIHDDDDSWTPEFLATTTAFLDGAADGSVAGVITHSVRVDERIVGDRVEIDRRQPYNDWVRSITLFRMAGGNMFPPISFLFRRSMLEEVGYYREDLPVLGDWEFNLRFLARRDIGVLALPLALYHHRPGNTNPAYANSIFGAQDKHALYDALIRNELMRRDLDSGRLGLGTLVNLGQHLSLLELKLNALFDAARFSFRVLETVLAPLRWLSRTWRRLRGR
ncbi:glycosyl transferase [Allostella humosa]|nr:glycosyl transferase [Stella humosa]